VVRLGKSKIFNPVQNTEFATEEITRLLLD
jgi:hypothetical protein